MAGAGGTAGVAGSSAGGAAGTGGGSGGTGGATGAAGTGVSGRGGASGTGGVSGRGGATGTGGTGGSGGVRVGCDNRDIDVPAVSVTTRATIGGTSAAGRQAFGTIHLSNAAGDDAAMGGTNVVSSTVKLVPGTYDVSYWTGGTQIPDDVVPLNADAVLRTGFVVGASGATALDVDVPTVAVGGTLTVGGAALLDTSDYGFARLTNALDIVWLAATSVGTYAVKLVPGTFDLSYSSSGSFPPAAGARAPFNIGAILRRNVALPAAGTFTLNVDVPVTAVSGAVRVNGAATSSAHGGYVMLRSADLGYVTLSRADTSPYAAKVVPGTYDVYLDAGTSPSNSRARFRQGVVIAAGTANTLDIDIPAAAVAGTVTIGGATAGSATDRGQISLVGAAGDSAAIAFTYPGPYTAAVVPGTYDVYYSSSAATGTPKNVPQNMKTRIAGPVTIAATGTTALDVDVPFGTVMGALKINGATHATSSGDYGSFFLKNAAGDQATLATTLVSTYSVRVVPGTYDLYYGSGFQPDLIVRRVAPLNRSAQLRTNVVVTAGGMTTLDIDLPTVVVSGALTIAGAGVAGDIELGDIRLAGASGDSVPLGPTSNMMYSVTIVPGMYDVYYAFSNGGLMVPRNKNVRLRCFDVSP